MIELGVNIDHIATLRQARKGPLLAFLHDGRRMVPGVFPGRVELLGDGKLCLRHVQGQAAACRLGTLFRSSCNDPSERTLHLRYTQKNS